MTGLRNYFIPSHKLTGRVYITGRLHNATFDYQIIGAKSAYYGVVSVCVGVWVES